MVFPLTAGLRRGYPSERIRERKRERERERKWVVRTRRGLGSMQSENEKCKQKLKVKDISQQSFNPFFISRCSIRLCTITVSQVERKLFRIFKRTGKINSFSPPQWEMTI